MTLRIATPADVSVLVTLMSEFYAESGFPLASEPATRLFSTFLSDARLGTIWLVDDAGETVGYVVVVFAFSMEYGGLRGFLDDFFIRPKARNRGLGAAAVDGVRTACRERGVKVLLVETGPDDHPAQRLYRRAGFSDIGRVFLTQPLATPLHEQA